jgi:hypothetical protein
MTMKEGALSYWMPAYLAVIILDISNIVVSTNYLFNFVRFRTSRRRSKICTITKFARSAMILELEHMESRWSSYIQRIVMAHSLNWSRNRHFSFIWCFARVLRTWFYWTWSVLKKCIICVESVGDSRVAVDRDVSANFLTSSVESIRLD